MAEATEISWCDSTFNGWIGCTKIAPACDFCYAAALDKRWGGDHWGNVPRRRTSVQNWNEPRRWQRTAEKFMVLTGRRRRVFCSSMSDIFDNQVDPAWRADLWQLIRETPDLDWLMLTKRPQNIEGMKPLFWDEVKHHVWLGTTVEDQKHADLNIPHLLKHDSAVRFLSCEPLLGPINLMRIPEDRPFLDGTIRFHLNSLTGHFSESVNDDDDNDFDRIDWVIAGGESGAHARPSNPQWFRDLRDQCEAAGVPFHFKQWGEWVSVSEVAGPGAHHKFDDGRTVRRTGKKLAGNTLDGVKHLAFPQTALQ